MQLARAVRNRTTGVLYVLDEPSIGLHPANLVGLTRVMEDLVADGNSVLLVDHDTQVLAQADWLLELGPGRGSRRPGDSPGDGGGTWGGIPPPRLAPSSPGKPGCRPAGRRGRGTSLPRGGSTCPPGPFTR